MSLSDQKTARLPAATEDQRFAAKPRPVVKLQSQGEAGKRTTWQRGRRRCFPGRDDGKRRAAPAGLEGPGGVFRSEGKIRLVQTLGDFDKALRGAAPGRRYRLGGNAPSEAYPGGLVSDRQLDRIAFAEKGVALESTQCRIRAKVRRKPGQHFFRAVEPRRAFQRGKQFRRALRLLRNRFERLRGDRCRAPRQLDFHFIRGLADRGEQVCRIDKSAVFGFHK